MTGYGIMSSVWDMILQCGSTIKVSIEPPVATRHRRDMTAKLLKATLNPNTHTQTQLCSCIYGTESTYGKSYAACAF